MLCKMEVTVFGIELSAKLQKSADLCSIIFCVILQVVIVYVIYVLCNYTSTPIARKYRIVSV